MLIYFRDRPRKKDGVLSVFNWKSKGWWDHGIRIFPCLWARPHWVRESPLEWDIPVELIRIEVIDLFEYE